MAYELGTVTINDAGDVKIPGNLSIQGSISIPDIWKSIASMSSTRQDAGVVTLLDGRVLAVGGNASPGTAEIYDPTTGVWTPTANLNVGRRNDHANFALLLPDGTVLVAGSSTSQPLTAEIYDPIGNTWTPTPNMANPHGQSSAGVVMPDGRAIIVGNNNANSKKSDVYDPIAQTWTTVGDTNSFHFPTLVASAVSGVVFVSGTGSETFDYAGSQTWTGTGGGGGGCIAPLADGRILSVDEIYDPIAQTWTPTGNLNIARTNATAQALSTGEVIVAGGIINPSPFTLTNTTELYNPVTGIWTLVGNMDDAKEFYRTTALAGGKAMLIGGFSVGAGELDTAQIFYTSAPTTQPAAGSAGQIQFNGGGELNAFGASPKLVWDSLAETLVISHVTGGAGINLGSVSGGFIQFMDNNNTTPLSSINGDVTGNITIETDQNATDNIWNFAIDGSLTNPGNVALTDDKMLILGHNTNEAWFKWDSSAGEITVQSHSSTNAALGSYGEFIFSANVGDTTFPNVDLRKTADGGDLIIASPNGVSISDAVNATPDVSATLDLKSTTRGFLPPRVTTAQRDAIVTPAQGLQIYNTDTTQPEVYGGAAWTGISSTVYSIVAVDYTAADGPNTMTTTVNAGLYQVLYYIQEVSASATTGEVYFTVAYNDSVGPATSDSSHLDMTSGAGNFVYGSIVVQADAATTITWQSFFDSITGVSPEIHLTIVLQKIV